MSRPTTEHGSWRRARWFWVLTARRAGCRELEQRAERLAKMSAVLGEVEAQKAAMGKGRKHKVKGAGAGTRAGKGAAGDYAAGGEGGATKGAAAYKYKTERKR